MGLLRSVTLELHQLFDKLQANEERQAIGLPLSSYYARLSDLVDGSCPEKDSIADDWVQSRRDMMGLLPKRQHKVCPRVAPDSERLDINSMFPPIQ